MGKGFAITNQKVSISIGLNGRINVRTRGHGGLQRT